MTWNELNLDLSKLQQRGELTAEMTQRHLEAKPKAVLNWVSQVWPFAHEMQCRKAEGARENRMRKPLVRGISQ